MRTYEVTLEVTEYRKVTVQSEEKLYLEDARVAAVIQEDLLNMNTRAVFLNDLTPVPPTDKERFNAAFKELRRLGYKARQNLTPYDDGLEVYTMREDVVDAFRGGELTGMMPVHWDYVNSENTVFHNQRVKVLTSVFEEHGFSVEWEGRFFNALQIRAKKEAL